MAKELAIEVKNVSISYRILNNVSIRSTLFRHKTRDEVFEAVKGVTFGIEKGGMTLNNSESGKTILRVKFPNTGLLQMMMYLSGVFYSIDKRLPAPFGELLEQFNPVAMCISSMRDALLYSVTPRVGILAIWGIISIILIALGVFTVYSNENSYVKVI